jgi:hypothetical protein
MRTPSDTASGCIQRASLFVGLTFLANWSLAILVLWLHDSHPQICEEKPLSCVCE